MGIKRIIAAIALVDFIALHVWAIYAEGLTGVVTLIQNLSPWGWILAADLVIALTMVLVWMWSDARQRGRNPLGYTLLTLGLGSIGTLLYYVTRKEQAPGPAISRQATLAAS